MSDIVLVTGPPLSGAGAVAAALRTRLDGCTVVDGNAGAGGFPDVVVFVTSAAAPMSDCEVALLASVTDRTDAVVGAVAKIDVHRGWRAVLTANRTASPGRAVPWVAVAASPEIGAPVIGPLVDAVRAQLDDEHRPRRNLLRARAWELQVLIAERERAAARREALRAKAARRDVLRMRVQRARAQLAADARERSTALRAELQRDAAAVSRRGIRTFESRVLHRAQQVAGEFDSAVAHRMAEVWAGIGRAAPAAAPPPPGLGRFPPPRTPALENRLTAVLGAGFGLGVVLSLGRVLAGLLPAAAAPAVVALCGAAGMALAGWVVRTRRLVTARAALDRWAAEVAAGLRTTLEGRVLATESALLVAHVAVLSTGESAGVEAADPAVERWAGELARVRAELGHNPD